jgi:hypothetical protein
MVSVVIFWSGGVVSMLRGIEQVHAAREISHVGWNLLVLAAAVVFDGLSWMVARLELRRLSDKKSIWSTIRESKTPFSFLQCSFKTQRDSRELRLRARGRLSPDTLSYGCLTESHPYVLEFCCLQLL